MDVRHVGACVIRFLDLSINNRATSVRDSFEILSVPCARPWCHSRWRLRAALCSQRFHQKRSLEHPVVCVRFYVLLRAPRPRTTTLLHLREAARRCVRGMFSKHSIFLLHAFPVGFGLGAALRRWAFSNECRSVLPQHPRAN